MPQRLSSVPGDAEFLPISQREIQSGLSGGMRAQHVTYNCGSCGKETNGRITCLMVRKQDNRTILWCVCSCPRQEPTILMEAEAGDVVYQAPIAREFTSNDAWPKDLGQLYDEAAAAFSAGANTACAMVCRKLLMATACREGDADGKSFAEYVTYITDTVLTFPKAKASIDKIRGIGNEANHSVRFVSPDDARRALQIMTYLLNAIYALPAS